MVTTGSAGIKRWGDQPDGDQQTGRAKEDSRGDGHQVQWKHGELNVTRVVWMQSGHWQGLEQAQCEQEQKGCSHGGMQQSTGRELGLRPWQTEVVGQTTRVNKVECRCR